MKTTVEIADDLLRAAKKAANDEGVSLNQLIDEGLRTRLGGPYAGFGSRAALYENRDDFSTRSRQRWKKGQPGARYIVNPVSR